MSPRNSTKARRDCFDAHKWTDPLSGRVMLTCHICGLPIDPVRERWEAEHVIRRVLKESDAPEDVLPAHKSCHAPKTARDIEENAKGKRVRDQHYGITRSKGPPMPGSKASPWKKKLDGSTVRRDGR